MYLDNFAFIEFAVHRPSLRERFIAAIKKGADVLFSVTNLAELGIQQGNSLRSIKSFLAEIGNCWFPVEMSAFEIVNRERAGGGEKSFISTQFIRDYFAFQVRRTQDRASNIVVIPGEESLSLEGVLDWATPQRESLLEGKDNMDAALKKRVLDSRKRHDEDSNWLNTHYPILPFDHRFRASFVLGRLMRGLIEEAKSHSLARGDGMDLGHAVVAAGFSSGGTLDSSWKRRVERIAGPHQLSPIYTSNQLEDFVSQTERSVENLRQVQKPSFIWTPG